ncbi:MAG: SRPBCC domain-containing protein [Pseudomonadota bacterium]
MATRIENASDEAVRTATGRDWAEWRRVLDDAGAASWSHKEIVAHLKATEDLSGWWQQTVTVGYEKMHGRRVVGQTADAGFQVGVQCTLPLDVEPAWQLITSPAGISTWLGNEPSATVEKGTRYLTSEGIEGEFRVVKPLDRVRLTWRPASGTSSTLQITLTEAGPGKTAVRFHHEKLSSTDEREEMRKRWRGVLDLWAAEMTAETAVE